MPLVPAPLVPEMLRRLLDQLLTLLVVLAALVMLHVSTRLCWKGPDASHNTCILLSICACTESLAEGGVHFVCATGSAVSTGATTPTSHARR